MKLKIKHTLWPLVGYSAIITACLHLITYGMVTLYDNWLHEIINLFVNFMQVLLMSFICLITIFKITDRDRLSNRFLWKLLADFIIAAILIALSYLIIILICNLFVASVEISYGSWLAVFLITMLMIETFYYIQNLKVTAQKADMLKLESLQYRFDAFRAQFNPHFLFNSLNNLIEIIDTDKEKAISYTESLSDIYRYVLQTHSKKKITVAEEVQFMYSYVDILKLKYNHFFSLDIRVRNNNILNASYIIPFSLQILVENVTKHNIISQEHPMIVHINIDDDCITVKNRICRKNNTTGTGMGLKYLSTQYNTFLKNVTITNENDDFIVKLPYIK